jgi:hydroxymethylbilane synthase
VGDEEILSLELMLPAPGQGAVAVQCRADDSLVQRRLAAIDDAPTRATTDAEREVLRIMDGSCNLGVGALAHLAGGDVVLDACVDDRRIRVRGHDPFEVARAAAADLGVLDVA